MFYRVDTHLLTVGNKRLGVSHWYSSSLHSRVKGLSQFEASVGNACDPPRSDTRASKYAYMLLCVHWNSGKISFKETAFWNTKDWTELQDLEGKVHPIIRIQSLSTLFSPLKVRVRFCRQPLEVSRGILTSVLASEVRFSQTAYINWFILTSNYFHFYNLPCKAYLLFLLGVSKMSHMGHLVIVRLNLTRDLCPESLSSLSLDISWPPPPDTNLIKATDHDLMYKTIFKTQIWQFLR